MKKSAIDREHLKLLIYGIPGSTKTRTAASAALDPRTAPVLMLEMGGNPVALGDFAAVPDIIHIEEMQDFNPIYTWLAKGQPASDPLVKSMDLHPPYKTIIIDQLTAIQRMAFRKITNTPIGQPGTFLPRTEFQHFGSVLAMMINFATLFFDLPNLHVIIVTLEREEKNEATGTITYKPLLWGQSEGEVSGIAYMVMRMVMREALSGKTLRMVEDSVDKHTVSVGLLQQTGIYVAKDQYGTGLSYMADPSVGKLLDAIQASGGNPIKP